MKRSSTGPVFCIIAGALAILFAILVMTSAGSSAGSRVSGLDTGTRTSYSYYGGDAYTGIQQAAADTARNVKALGEIVKAGFRDMREGNGDPSMRYGISALLAVTGLALIGAAVARLAENRSRAAFEQQVLMLLVHGQEAAAPVPAPMPEAREETAGGAYALVPEGATAGDGEPSDGEDGEDNDAPEGETPEADVKEPDAE